MSASQEVLRPFWVCICFNADKATLQSSVTSAPTSTTRGRACTAISEGPGFALLTAVEKFLYEFPDVEPGQLNYRIRAIGHAGFLEGPNLMTDALKALAEERILHRSTSSNLPVKNFTAFFSIAGLPFICSEVIQVRTATHAALALRRGVQHRLCGLDPDVTASIFEGIHEPVDTLGHEVVEFSGTHIREFLGIRVPDGNDTKSGAGFTVVELCGPPKVTFVRDREGTQRVNQNRHSAMLVLGGNHPDLLPSVSNTLFDWEDHGFYDTVCEALSDTIEIERHAA